MDQGADAHSLMMFQMAVLSVSHNMWKNELLGGGLFSECFSTLMTRVY